MKAEYVNHMGDDLTVANAARVSFHKYKEEFHKSDEKLLRYLAKNNHWTPFSHPQISLRIKAPIFVARQLYKHKVGMTENEVSRRYVDDPPEFFLPDTWRGRPTNGAKQGSSEDEVAVIVYRGVVESWTSEVNDFVLNHYSASERLYESMIEGGIAPEQARMVLPQSMYTEWIWTGSLASYARICKQRLDPHAQAETREIAEQIAKIIAPLFPVSWSVLMGENIE